jgi:hypothetical protein
MSKRRGVIASEAKQSNPWSRRRRMHGFVALARPSAGLQFKQPARKARPMTPRKEAASTAAKASRILSGVEF